MNALNRHVVNQQLADAVPNPNPAPADSSNPITANTQGFIPANAGGASAPGDVSAQIDTCNGTCTIGEQCGDESGATEDCGCKVVSSTYNYRLATEFYTATCMSLSLLTKRGLDDALDAACPCNTSYVSHACCEARDGRVWEDASLKLGELWRGEDL